MQPAAVQGFEYIPDCGVGFKALCGSMSEVDQTQISGRVAREISHAHEARRHGREGRARVCARRAAGWAARAYYERQTGTNPPRSALTLLRWLQKDDGIGEQVRGAAQRLTTHVTPSHELPFDEDPLVDAQLIIEALAGIEI